jgi:hypothetical protein
MRSTSLKLFLFVFSVILIERTNAQIYSRNSVTPIFINFKSGVDYSNSADSVRITNKFDYNYFGSNTLSVNANMISPSRYKLDQLGDQISELRKIKEKSKSMIEQISRLSDQITEVSGQLKIEDSIRGVMVTETFLKSKIPNKILSSLLIDENSKVMTLDVLAKRSEYNASDADYVKAMNSEAKLAAIKDKGLDLLKNVYIFLIDTKSKRETSADEKNPSLKNVTISGIATLYKIDIDTLVKAGLFDEMVFTDPNQTKYNNFKNYPFALKSIMEASFSSSTPNFRVQAESTANIAKALLNSNSGQNTVKYVMKSEDEIVKECVNEIFDDAQKNFTKDYKPFQVKVNVIASDPIRAKIGTKESLHVDDLYMVSENVQGENNEIVEKRVGWVRAKKVSDNMKNADGNMEPSTFYRTWSKSVSNGMKLSQKPETGIILGVGYSAGSQSNVMSGPYVSLDYITHISAGLRAGITIGGFGRLEPSEVFLAGASTSKNTLNFSGTNLYADMTVQKIFGGNRFEITPMLGAYLSALSIDKYYVRNVENKVEDNASLMGLTNTAYGGLAGVKFGINLGRNLQINVGYKLGIQVGSALAVEDGSDVTYNNRTVTMNFDNPAAAFLGLRLFGF